ncbi:PEP-CTERM sorting domain-containing protein [Telluria antibiotica]|nr:PEP-CTERM sorting domain-containing protein [Telluria antibiotica]
MTMTFRMTALAALLGATTMTAQAGVLTLDGVTFTSNWNSNVLTLEIDAANRSGGWSDATGLAALAIKGVGTYSSVSVGSAPGGTGAWKLSTSELKASGCSGTSNGAAGSRMCFYGQQIALADDMVFKFTFDGAAVTPVDPHVKVEFVDAQGRKVGSLLSQTLPPSPVKTAGDPPVLPPTPDLPTTVPVADVPDDTPAGGDAGSANVPEPRSIALLLGGLGLMGVTLRRRGGR